jgi:hypothetical protein
LHLVEDLVAEKLATKVQPLVQTAITVTDQSMDDRGP